MKTTNKVFTIKINAKQVVLKIIIVDKVDRLNKFNNINKHKKIVLS